MHRSEEREMSSSTCIHFHHSSYAELLICYRALSWISRRGSINAQMMEADLKDFSARMASFPRTLVGVLTKCVRV